jgi:hypothetical protein
MSGTGEATHVRTNLGQDHFGQASLNAWDRRESLDLVLIWSQPLGDLCAHALDGFIKGINIGELFSAQKALLRL